ncbi:MAG: 3' terminal RNA ribose 2'-O-methyltransferase Hen1 [Polyangiaceae bacterium]|nr:3' terminal RNA ribose 2'-O-methyltransferase Hen1 [Polyangiaceae bacterium]
MLFTLTTTHQPATDLGYLLGKHPDRVQSFELASGRALVFFPEASHERCSATLALDVDPVGLTRDRTETFDLEPYVNDRPYVASSWLSVAIARVFSSAMQGKCRDRPELAGEALDFEVELPVVSLRGGEGLLRELFEPLGYQLEASALALDPVLAAREPEAEVWHATRYFRVQLRGKLRLAELLSHLYVLLPVMDDNKHYWVDETEVEKLLARGAGWLEQHPLKERITKRYLKHQRGLTAQAIERLQPDTEEATEVLDPRHAEAEERALEELVGPPEPRAEKPKPLDEQRREVVLEELATCGAARVLDLGCGEGKLLRRLAKQKQFSRVVGCDVSLPSLIRAAEKLRIDPDAVDRHDPEARVNILQSSLCYRDARLRGFDAACLIEVIEHLDANRLGALEHSLFADAKPQCVLVSTPNREYNVNFPGLADGKLRHRDHRFEWTRGEFQAWATSVAARHQYSVRFRDIGQLDPAHGAPTQLAVFTATQEAACN